MRVRLIQLQEVEAFLVDPKKGGPPSPCFVDVEAPLPEPCFALDAHEFEDYSLFPGGGVAIFACQSEPVDAVEKIYLLRYPVGSPRLCRMVRSEEQTSGKDVFRAPRRKSFMTPTPLHIPTSKVSPIPDYTHSVFYLRRYDQEKLEVVATDQSARLLPLVFIQPGSDQAR